MSALATYARPAMADESEAWLRRLRASGAERERAVAELHALLLRAAHHELARRQVAATDRDDLAVQAADDALVAVLAKLDSFRGASRFTTWAYKFALLEAGVKARRRAWQGREIPLADDAWNAFADRGPSAHDSAETGELLRAIRVAVDTELTDHQREVFVALALQRGADRRARGAPRHHARRALQDPPRRAPPAPRRARRPRPGSRVMNDHPPSSIARCSAPTGPRSAARSASSASTSTSTLELRARRRRASRAWRAHLDGLPGLPRGPREPARPRQPRGVTSARQDSSIGAHPRGATSTARTSASAAIAALGREDRRGR